MVNDIIIEARGSQPRRSARPTPRRSAAAARLRRYCTTAAAVRRGVCCVAPGRVVIEGHWLARQKIWGQWGFVPIKFSVDVIAQINGERLCHRIDCPHLI